MKISAKQYAQTLYELTEKKPEKEISRIVSNFIKYLAKNNDLKFGTQIIEKFNNIWNENHGVVEAEVTSREELSNEVRIKLSNYVSNKFKAKEVVFNNKVDESIKGGIVIKVEDEILDASISNQIKDLRKKLMH
jgi:F-type H+-transporting ATPase subunit delta